MGRSGIENVGLIAFKERWGAAKTSLRYWTYPQRLEMRISAWQNSLAGRVASVAPDLVLQAAGTLWYRHIG